MRYRVRIKCIQIMQANHGLSKQFVFGVHEGINNSLHFWNENRIVYVGGHSVIDYNIEEHNQSFYNPAEGSTAITALTMSPKRFLIAFAESRKNSGAVVSIYNKRQRKRCSLTAPNSESNIVSCLAFSTDKDERYLLILYNSSTPSLVYWCWNSPHVKSSIDLTNRIKNPFCSFSPLNSDHCVLTGKNTFLFLHGETKVNGKEELLTISTALNEIKAKDEELPIHSHNYITHCWTIEGMLIIATDKGELLVLDSSGYLVGMKKIDRKIECMTRYKFGLIVVCKGPTIFTLSIDRIILQSIVEEDKQFMFGEITDSITNIAVNPVNDKILICITNTSQILKVEANKEPRTLICDFHSKSIRGMDVCVRKPLVVTCSNDNSIKIWNYIERRMEITFKHPDVQPISVAFHPSSLYLVVGCITKLYIMNVGLTTLKIAQEIGIKQFKDVAFSHSGRYLALSYAGMLQVFNFYTMEVVPGCTISRVRVQTIDWYDDDTGFITTDRNNCVSFCSLDSNFVNVPINNKEMISGVVKVPGVPLVFAACSDCTIKEVTRDTVSKRMDLSEVPGQVAISKDQKYFFIGTGEENMPGSVRCYNYPMNPNEYISIPAHAKEVRKMKLSPGGKYLFSGGEDGCLILYTINEGEERRGHFEYSKEVLIDKHQLNELRERLKELQRKRKELKKPRTSEEEVILSGLEQDLERAKIKVRQKQNEREEITTSSNDKLAELNFIQHEKKKAMSQEYVKEIERMKRQHMEEYAQRANEYSRKYTELENLMNELKAMRKTFAQECKEEIEEFRKLKEREMEDVLESIKEKTKILDSNTKKQSFLITQITEDNTEEMKMVAGEHKTQIRKKNEKIVKIHGERHVTGNKADKYNEKTIELERDIKELKHTINKVESEGDLLQTRIKGLNDILADKSKSISKLEYDIYQHKSEAQKLEKFKFVLDYKIKELKHEMDPRERQIGSLREKTIQMNVRLKKFNNLNKFLGARVKELQEAQITLQQRVVNNRERLRRNIIHKKECLDALSYCAKFIHSPNKLKRTVLENLSQYKAKVVQIIELPPVLLHEFQLQENFMAESLRSLEKELKETKKIRVENNKLARDQNKVLLREIKILKGLLAKGSMSLRSSMDIIRSKNEFDELNDNMRAIEENKNTIRMLRERVQSLTKQNEELKATKYISI